MGTTGASEFTEWLNNMGAGTFILIILFVITVASALSIKIKTVFDKHRKKVEIETKKQMEDDELKETVKKMCSAIETLTNKVERIDKLHDDVLPKIDDLDKQVYSINDLGDILIETSKSSIKAFIISEYQKWMSLQYIDIYSLSMIEDQFAKYEKMNGNSFVKDMVVHLRKLPTRAYIQDVDGKDPVGYFDIE